MVNILRAAQLTFSEVTKKPLADSFLLDLFRT